MLRSRDQKAAPAAPELPLKALLCPTNFVDPRRLKNRAMQKTENDLCFLLKQKAVMCQVPGEFAFVQPFHGRFGNSLDCLVYLKQVELDDCPFLLALHCFLPDEDERPEHSFYKAGMTHSLVRSMTDGYSSNSGPERLFFEADMSQQANTITSEKPPVCCAISSRILGISPGDSWPERACIGVKRHMRNLIQRTW